MGYVLYGDAGNTSFHVGLWDGQWLGDRRFASEEIMTAPERCLTTLLGEAGLALQDCDGALLSVNAPRTEAISAALEEVLGVPVRLLGRDVTIDLPVRYETPQAYGKDRLLGVYAARELVGSPCIVVDAGTCITCDALTAEGTVLSIGIAPGLSAFLSGVQREAPALAEALMPMSEDRHFVTLLPAESTAASLSVGFLCALAGTTEALVRAAYKALGARNGVSVVLTGGDADLVRKLCTIPLRSEPLLLLEGLRRLDTPDR